MAIAHRDTQSTGTNATAQTSITVTKPTGTVSGDVLIGYVTHKDPGLTITPPAGWTTLYSGTPAAGFGGSTDSVHQVWIGYKVAGGSEGANYQWTFAASKYPVAIVTCYSGVDNTDPIACWHEQSGSGDGSYDWVNVFDAYGSSMALAFASNGSGAASGTAPGGWTERNETGVGSNNAGYFMEKSLSSTPGASSAPTGMGFGNANASTTEVIVLLRDDAVNPVKAVQRGWHLDGDKVTSSVVAKKPACVEGDLLLAAISHDATSAPTVTPPSGWTLLQGPIDNTNEIHWLYYKVAGASEPTTYTWSFSTSGTIAVTTVACGNCQGAAPDATASGNGISSTATAASVTTLTADSLLLTIFSGYQVTTAITFSTPSGMTETMPDLGHAEIDFWAAVDYEYIATASATGTRASTISASVPWSAFTVAVAPLNRAPNAPSVVAPVDSVVLDRAITQRFDWDFSDPDGGDTQSKYDLDYRLVGAGSWTTVTGITPNTYHDFAGSTFAAGNYEWRVRTYDALGLLGPYSTTEFFTAANAPATPTITDPINNQTIPVNTYVVRWSAPDQDSYQVRRVADNAGSPDTGTVYYDSGEVVSTTARSKDLSFAVNNRYEHIQVRIKNDGLWSSWASVRVQISYTQPPVPTLILDNNDAAGRVEVDITNPAPGGGEPALVYNDLYRREVGGEWIRIATALGNSANYNDYGASAGVSYEYKVVAFGDNSTSIESDVEAAPVLTLRGSWIHDPEDPGGTVRQFVYNDNGGDVSWEAESAEMTFAGRVDPFVEYGEHESYEIRVNLAAEEDTGDYQALIDFLQSKKVLCYRDAYGRKIYSFPGSWGEKRRGWGGFFNLRLKRHSYTEGV